MTDVINDGSARWAGVYSYNSKKWRRGEGVINGWVAVGQLNQKTQLKMKHSFKLTGSQGQGYSIGHPLNEDSHLTLDLRINTR